MPVLALPDRPNLNHLKRQAKDLLRAVKAGDASASTLFSEFGPNISVADGLKLADAQLVVARCYGASSWPRLVVICTLIDALWRSDVHRIQQVTAQHTELGREYGLAPTVGWAPAMTKAANHGLQAIVQWLRQAKANDVAAASSRPELAPLVETLRHLGALGARFPKHAIGGAVESLSGSNFSFMVNIGTEIEDEHGDWRSRVALVLETYARNPVGKHEILETMIRAGISLPDTPPMALHRGRFDLLGAFVDRDPSLLSQTFTHEQFFPPSLGCHADHALALVGVSLNGCTLLHMAIEYEEIEIAQWLLARGVDVNQQSHIDGRGFGGHTALFHCVVTYNAGQRDDRAVRLLLDHGANPNARASLRTRLPFATDKSFYEYRNVTPFGWGTRFHDQSYVSRISLRAIIEGGGVV